MLRIDPAARTRLPGLWACGQRLEATGTPVGALPEAATMLDPAWTLDNLKDDDGAAGFRTISWAVGVDPTKNRPAGEALARRILNGGALPHIHPLVDAYNLASAATLTPLGAYDLDVIDLPLTVRPAVTGERFEGIGRAPEALDEGRLVYATGDGTVCGVFMWRDAQHSRVQPHTRRVLLLAVGADPVPATVGHRALEEATRLAPVAGFAAVQGIIDAV